MIQTIYEFTCILATLSGFYFYPKQCKKKKIQYIYSVHVYLSCYFSLLFVFTSVIFHNGMYKHNLICFLITCGRMVDRLDQFIDY